MHVVRCLVVMLLLITCGRVEAQSPIIIIGAPNSLEELVVALQSKNVIDKQQNWNGKTRQVISFLPLLNHKTDSAQIVEFIINLQAQAKVVGGNVTQVINLQTIQALTGDYSNIPAHVFLSYAPMSSTREREALFAKYLYQRQSDDTLHVKNEFDLVFPLGFSGFVRAWSQAGKIGSWLRSQSYLAANIDNIVYVNGLSAEDFANRSIPALNSQIKDLILRSDDSVSVAWEQNEIPFRLDKQANPAGQFSVAKANNKHWDMIDNDPIFTNLAITNEIEGCSEAIDSFAYKRKLKHLNAKKMIISSPPKSSLSFSRFNQGLIVLDSRALSVLDSNESVQALLAKNINKHGFLGNPPDMSDADVEHFLLTAEVIDNKPIGSGVTRSKLLTLKKEDRVLRAAFKILDTHPKLENSGVYRREFNASDRYQYEVAAYKLDRLLGQNLVPPSVIRKIGRRHGAVQLWIENVITEKKRINKSIAYTGACNIDDIQRLRVVFDTLIYNVDRNYGNMLWDKHHNIYLIDHTRSFSVFKKSPKSYAASKIALSSFYRSQLESLNIKGLKTSLGNYLHPNQISAILHRRDFLIEVDNKITQ